MDQDIKILWDQIQWDQVRIRWDLYDPFELHRDTAESGADGPAALTVARLVSLLLGADINALRARDPTLLHIIIDELERAAQDLKRILDSQEV